MDDKGHLVVDEAERDVVIAALDRACAEGNETLAAAARILGWSRNKLKHCIVQNIIQYPRPTSKFYSESDVKRDARRAATGVLRASPDSAPSE